jgi:hypothetical protein
MLILKQNAANSVPTPPAGKGTIFLDDSDTLSVKTSDGNVETFPTVAAANTQVVFIDGTALTGNANFVYNKNTETLTLAGTLATGNVKTDNLLYANGSPWDLSDPGGSNTQVQFNDDESFGGSAAFTFNKSTNAISMGGALTVTGNASAGNISTGGVLSVTGNANVGNLGTGGLIVATGNVTGGNLVTTGTGSVGELAVSGNAVITGNLAVNGNVTYVNVDTLQVEDPVISLGGGPNGAPLTSNDGKDRGTLLNYYTTSAIDAFMGWDSSNGEFGFGSNVSIVNDVVTFNTLGNVRASTLLANVNGGTGAFSGNVTAGNVYANAGTIGASLLTGTLTTAAQPNITSVGTLTGLGVNGNITGVNVSANTGAFYGNAAGLTNIPGGNIVGNISGNISNANYAAFAGQVVDSTQSNITAVGKLTSLLAGTDATSADFTNATVIAAKGNSGVTSTASVGLVGEGVSTDSGNSSAEAIGLFGIGSANGSAKGTGVQGTATVKATGDTGAAVGVRGIASATHAGGYNIGVLGNAAGSGVGNYAFYVQSGDIASIEANTIWDLYDNSSGALSFNSSGKAGILAVSTADSAEGVSMSGTLSVTGNITATAGIKTDNYFYANGSPVDFQQAGGTNTQIQFNDADSFGGSAAFTFNKTSNVVTMSGNLSVANVQATGDVTTATLTSNGNANVGNLGTGGLIVATGNVTGGNLTTAGVVTATGNVSGGNLTTAGVVAATGNVSGGNLTTAGVVAATGNVSGGNLTTAGVVAATGNVSGGNINTAGKVVASTLESNVATGTAPFTVASTTKVTNLNADLLDGFTTDTTATANTVVVRDSNGNIAANNISGTITSGVQTNITQVGTLTGLNITGNVTAGNVYANAGTIGAANLTGTLTTAAQPNITSVGTLSSLTVSGNASAGNLSTGGVLSVTGNANVGNLGTGGLIVATGNVTGGNLVTSGALSVTGNANVGNLGVTGVVATTLGGSLTTASQPNITSVGTLTSLGVTGNVTAGNVYANSGTIGAANLTGTLTTAAQPNITSVGTLSSLTVSGNVAAGNLTTTGVLSVTGTGVSSIAGNLDMTSNNIINLATPVNATDAATKQYVDDVAQGLNIHDSCAAATPDTLANITSGTITYNNGTAGVGATLVTTGTFNLIDGVNVQTAGTRILVKNEANAVFNGIYTYTNTTAITRATDFNSIPEVEAGDFTFVTGGTLYDNTGWVQTESPTGIGTAGNNISFTQFSGAGTYNAGTGLTLTGSTFSVNVAQPTITSLGTLTGLGVNGNITAANITANTGVFTGNGSGLTALAGGNVTGQVANALVAGTVYTAAQPNITSVGTLTSLSVTGNASAGNISTGGVLSVTGNANVGNIGATNGVFTNVSGNGAGLTAIAGGNVTGQVANALVAGTVYTAAQPNITSVGTLTSLTVTGNASAGNISTGGVLSVTGNANVGNIGATNGVFTNVSGNGAALTALNASNISTGTLAQARLANSTITVNGTTLTLGGTSTITANTTNTLTLGTYLTGTSFNGGAAVTAAVDATDAATASKVVARDTNGSFSANVITANSFVGAASTAGTVTTAAQPNITSVGQLTSLAVTGNITANNFNANSYFVSSVNAAVSAAGTVQGNATALTKMINVTSTVDSGAGVALPTAVAGMRITLINTAANAVLVYPASGGAINSLATNASYSLPAAGKLDFVAVSTTQWYTLNATYA